jgi:short-subunit dehydrogenase
LRFSDQLIRHRGGILNVGSLAGFLPGPGMAVYYASKAYVLSFSEALREELGRAASASPRCVPARWPSEFQKRAGIGAGPSMSS